MRLKTFVNKAVITFLRLAAITYLFAAVFPFIVDPGFESNFGIWTVRWGLIILLALTTLLFFIINRSEFILYGFFVVFIVAIYQIFITLTGNFSIPSLFLHIYVLATSVYFITHDMRLQSGSNHHHKRSKGKTEKIG